MDQRLFEDKSFALESLRIRLVEEWVVYIKPLQSCIFYAFISTTLLYDKNHPREHYLLKKSTKMDMLAALPDDFFVTSSQFTKTTYRDGYPSIDPSSPALSQAGKVVIVTGANQGLGRLVRPFPLHLPRPTPHPPHLAEKIILPFHLSSNRRTNGT